MNKRNTTQCSIVYETVQQMRTHPTADEVYDQIKQQYPHISRGTVYRNLQRLCDEGKIKKRDIPASASCYDHFCHDHYHIKCIKCSRVFDLDMDYIEHLEANVKDQNGFEFISHDIVFKGICPNCKKK